MGKKMIFNFILKNGDYLNLIITNMHKHIYTMML